MHNHDELDEQLGRILSARRFIARRDKRGLARDPEVTRVLQYRIDSVLKRMTNDKPVIAMVAALDHSAVSQEPRT